MQRLENQTKTDFFLAYYDRSNVNSLKRKRVDSWEYSFVSCFVQFSETLYKYKFETLCDFY